MATTLAALGVLVGIALLAFALFALRRRLIHRPGGTFDCGLRVARPDRHGGGIPAESFRADGKGWTFGVGRYSGDEVAWFRVFSYSPRPRLVLHRPDIEILGKRHPDGADELALLSGWMIVVCRHRAQDMELAMSEDALTGFLAWLEAAPPGQRVNVA